jgi:hypothetical protein
MGDVTLRNCQQSVNRTGSVLGVVHIFPKCVLVNFLSSVILMFVYCRYKFFLTASVLDKLFSQKLTLKILLAEQVSTVEQEFDST